MDYNYIDKEQGTTFEYCNKHIKKRAFFGVIVLTIIFVPVAIIMAYLSYMSFLNPSAIGASGTEIILGQIFSPLMFILTSISIYYYIFLPLVKKSHYKNIFISQEGVYSQVNDNFIPWDEVKNVSIGLKGLNNSVISYIFIQHNNFKHNKWTMKNIMNHDGVITMECTQEKIDAIEKYYHDEIENIERYQPRNEKKIMKTFMIYLLINFIVLVGILFWMFFFL